MGWRKAVKVAQAALEYSAVDHGQDDAKFHEDLMNIAKTTLSSKILVHQKNHFAKLAVDAVLRLKVVPLHLYSTLKNFSQPMCKCRYKYQTKPFALTGKRKVRGYTSHKETRWKSCRLLS